MTKLSIHQEDMTTTNIYAANIRTPIYMKQMLREPKGENSNTIISEDYNTLLPIEEGKLENSQICTNFKNTI